MKILSRIQMDFFHLWFIFHHYYSPMNFSSLPHKNLYLSAAFAALIIGVGAIVHYKPSFLLSRNNDGNVVTMNSDTASSSITSRDTDEDGLHDWEEQLYGSDPRKRDSDGDSTIDGEEVQTGRNPIIANTAKEGETPTDLTEYSRLLFASSTELSEQKKAFLAQYLTQAGKDIRETTYRDLLSKFDAKDFTPTPKQLTGMNIVSDNTDDGFRNFINEFGKVVLKHKTPYAPRNEITVINEYMQSKKPQLLEELQLCVIEYNNLVKDLLALPVPSGNAKTLQTIILGYEGMALGIEGLQKIETNPVDAAGGYEGYTMYRVEVVNGYVALVNEVAKRNMIFTREEPGYMFYANVFATTTPSK